MKHYYATTEQADRLTQLAIASGVSMDEMIETAGMYIKDIFRIYDFSQHQRVVIFCGSGSKGGCGLAAGRALIDAGQTQVTAVLLTKRMRDETQKQLELFKKAGGSVSWFEDKEACHRLLREADSIIDALIGYHLDGVPRGLFFDAVSQIEAAKKKVISYDVPTGVDTLTGECLGVCITAEITLTLGIPKKVFLSYDGKTSSGDIFILDVGVPEDAYDQIEKGIRPHFDKTGIMKLT